MNPKVKYAIYFIAAIIGICVAILIPWNCECFHRNKTTKVYPNAIQKMIDAKQHNADSLVKENRKIDSAAAANIDTVTIYRNVVKYKYIEVIKLAPDTCRPYIETVNQGWQKVDSVNQVVITDLQKSNDNGKKALADLTDVNTLTKYQLQQSRDSTKQVSEENKDLTKKVKQQTRKGNVKTVLTGIGSFLIGAATGKLTK